MTRGRVVVAMSGGVDSSVAALLLKEAGYQVVGITMRLWTLERPDAPPLNRRCCSVEDVEDARQVCQTIGVPHYVLNAEEQFKAHVVDYFVREYQRGRTPHPCIACNDRIKFDFLLERALALEAEFIATGHYARIGPSGDGSYALLKASDAKKDQSYVLFGLTQEQLKCLLLPVGDYTKQEIRALAARARLPVADKPDSQEICFIPDGDYRRFLASQVKPRPGEILDTKGRVLGQHGGVELFTIGQRRGLGLATGTPLFVVDLDAQSNHVIVGSEEKLQRSTLWAGGVNWLRGAAPSGPVEVSVKIRYKATEVSGLLLAHGQETEVRFQEPQRAVTPGQAVVFYRGDELLGGGFIQRGNEGRAKPREEKIAILSK